MKKIIFFGDSVTDTYNKQFEGFDNGLGYVNMITGEMKVINPSIEIINKGIGGNKTTDLLNRIDNDVLSQRPDVVFLLIGINDIWHPFDEGLKADFNKVNENINKIVSILESNNIKVVVVSPFIFPISLHFANLKQVFDEYMVTYYENILANNYPFIDMYKVLSSISNVINPEFITNDSVHPSLVGHAIIAKTILDYMKTNLL